MDATAISLCHEIHLPIVIFILNERGNIRRVVMGEAVGSLVSAGCCSEPLLVIRCVRLPLKEGVIF
jgi:hypothetical protein